MKTNLSTAHEALSRGRRKILRAGHSPPAALRVLDIPLPHCASTIDPEWRQKLIAQAAYCFAERRGFEPGHELEDWLTAEQAIDAELTAGHTPVPKYV